jgi:hypothetical protein
MNDLRPTQKKMIESLLLSKELQLEESMTTMDTLIEKFLNEVPRNQEKVRVLIFNHTQVANELNEVRELIKLINL